MITKEFIKKHKKIFIILITLIIIIILVSIVLFFALPFKYLTFIDKSGALCKLRGAHVQAESHYGVPYNTCYEKYKDANKKCTDSNQCKGSCIPAESCKKAYPSGRLDSEMDGGRDSSRDAPQCSNLFYCPSSTEVSSLRNRFHGS